MTTDHSVTAPPPEGPDPDLLEETLRRWSHLIRPGVTPSATIRGPDVRGDRRWSGLLRTVSVSDRPVEDPALFEIETRVGEGGMGEVLSARQVALDRRVAIKRLHPGGAHVENDRQRFLAEAVVTGDLDHPNIVPVHDLASTQDGTPFYAMKLVRGRSWDAVIDDLSEDENLDILLKVADAVAFAHSRGVIHRDLKPQNVMLGDFGEVLVMDWGLAASVTDTAKASRLDERSAFGGTAAYMPPEMAMGSMERIGTASDVYLLGAVLFRALTGRTPHDGASVMACLTAAAQNTIVATPRSDEFVSIALEAMATDPRRRFPDVTAFQQTLREARAHAQSRRLMKRAEAALDEARRTGEYPLFERSRYGFEEAAALWPENPQAAAGADAARLAQARAAFEHQDLDLAASLLTGDAAEETELAEEVSRERAIRDSRQRRLRRMRRVATGLAAALVVVLTVGLALIAAENNRAERAEALANSQSEVALDTLDALVFSVNDALEDRPGLRDLRRDLLDVAVNGLEKVVAAEQEAEQVDRRLAVAHQSLARIAHIERQTERALEHQRQAVALFEALHQSDVPSTTLDLAEALQVLGEIEQAYRMGDISAAREAVQRSLELAETLPPDEPEHQGLRFGLRLDLIDLAVDADQLTEAEIQAQRLLVDAEQWAESVPESRPAALYRAHALARLAEVAVYREQPETAVGFSRRRLEILTGLADRHPSDTEITRLLALAHQDLGDTLRRIGVLDEATRMLADAASAQRQLIADDPSRGQVRRDLVTTLWSQGELEVVRGRPDIAMQRYTGALDAAEALLELNPANLEAMRDVFICAKELGGLHLEAGRLADARRWYDRGRTMTEALMAAQPDSLNAATDHVISHYYLGLVHQNLGDCASATGEWEAGIAILQALIDDGRIGPESRFAGWPEEFQRLVAECHDG
jgi:tetratricopeptide (TPR) repeat protein